MSIALRIPVELEKKLEHMAKKTKRSKSFLVREAVETYLEDLEDYHIAKAVLDHPGKIYSIEEVRKHCGLED